MFPQTQKHTLGRAVDLDVTQKHSLFNGSDVTSIPPSQCDRFVQTYQLVG